MISSCDESVVFVYSFSGSSSVVLLCPPHYVCLLRYLLCQWCCICTYCAVLSSDLLKQVRHTELHALCSQVGYRFKHPIIGADLFAFPSDTYAAVVVCDCHLLSYQLKSAVIQLTALGDVVYQCWKYSSSSKLQTTSALTETHFAGLVLWIKQAYEAGRMVCDCRKHVQMSTAFVV